MRTILIVYGILFCGAAFSQKWTSITPEVFQQTMIKCSAQNNKENYSMEFKRLIYANAMDAEPISKSSGKLFRGKGKEYRVESENSLMIQNKDVKMVLDSAELLILLMKPDTIFDQVDPKQWFSGQNLELCTFSSQVTGSKTFYRIVFDAETSSYQEMVLTLDTKTSALFKIEFKLAPANYMSNDFEDLSTEEPKIIVEYQPMIPLKANSGYFNLDSWIKRSGEKYELQPQIKFTLDDLRIQTNPN